VHTDPLNGETIDTEHINEKLRDMAIARWGQQVDAIIHITTKNRRHRHDDDLG
jgi:hypothetical protein